MRYRGFVITSCFDSGIERYNRESGEDELCHGYYCQVYAGNDDLYAEQIDDFCLAAGHEIEDLSDAALSDGIRKYVDGIFRELEEGRIFNKKAHLADMLGRAVCFLGEFQSGEELYDTLTEQIGLSDDEIREIGFKSLAQHFDRDCYAQTIAEFLVDEGTDKTHSGNYHFPFAEINERFGTSLPGDKEMMDKIVSALDSEIVADVDTTEDFDLMFYLDFCPYAEESEELENTPSQQM